MINTPRITFYRFAVLISECETPSDPNTMPPLIQSHDGISPSPRLHSQTVNKHIAMERLSLCVSHPVFTKKRKDVSCFWQINPYITGPLCSQVSTEGWKWLSVGGISNYIVQSGLLNVSFSLLAYDSGPGITGQDLENKGPN